MERDESGVTEVAETPAPEPRRESRAAAVVGVVAAALVVFAVLSLVFLGIARTPVSVPMVTGLTAQAAGAALRSADLTPGAELVRIEPGYPAGSVIEQRPEATTGLPRGAKVDLVIAEASVPATVPDLSLATKGVATQSLLDLWLTPVESSQLSSSVPFGDVISQLPTPGTPVVSSARVAVVISEGPGHGGVPVPDLVGKKAADAAAILADAHLFPAWLNVSTTSPTETPTGVVTGQAVSPGGLVQVGSNVALTLKLPQ